MRRPYALLLSILLHLTLSLSAQWEHLPVPGVDNILQVAQAKDRLYARSEDALYYSRDLGASWQWLTDFSIDYPGTVNALATRGDTVFVGKGSALWFSVDFGRSWAAMTSPLPGLPVGAWSVINDYLVANFGSAYWKYHLPSNGGWAQITNVNQVQESGGEWWAFRYGATGNDTILRSGDHGDTWEPVTTHPNIKDLIVTENSLLVVSYGAWYDDVLVRKTGDPATAPWVTFSHPGDRSIELQYEYGHCLAHFSNPFGAYYLLASIDGFASWDTLTVPGQGNQFLTAGFVIRGDRWIMPALDHGIALSDDDGKNWYYAETGLHDFDPDHLPEFGNNIRTLGQWLTLERDFQPPVYSSSAGQAWFRPIAPVSMPLQPTAYSQGYYFGWGSVPGNTGDFCDSLYRSPDGISNWELIKPTGFTWCGYNLFGTEKYLFAYYHDGSFPVLARSADAGLNWTFLNVPDVPGGQLDTMGGHLFWYNSTKVWVSDDDGQSFVQSGTFPSDVNVQQVTFADGAIYVYRYENNFFNAVRKSVDQGQNWVNHTQNLTDGSGNPRSVLAFDHRNGKTVVLSATSGISTFYNLWVSDDDGASWRQVLPISDLLNSVAGSRVRLTDNYLYLLHAYYKLGYRLPIGRLENLANTGQAFFDANTNGQFDPGETGLAGLSIQGLPYGQQTVTDSAGQYNLYGNFLADTLRPVMPSPHAVSEPPFRITTSPAQNQDFAIRIGTGIQDLVLAVTPHAPFRPGFETSISVECRNLGNTVNAPSVRLVLPAECELVAAQPAPSVIDGDTLVWVLPAMQFLEKQVLRLTLKTEVATPIGAPLLIRTLAGPSDSDATPQDNLVLFQAVVVGSYDPNDKIVTPANYVTTDLAAGNPLNYTIRFQNTGTYPATKVRIADTLSERLDWTTFRVEQSSHPVTWELGGSGVVTFQFPGIVLPFAAEDEAGSQGFVRYSIRPKPDLMIGEGVSNTAYIYFDFNSAIITNTVESVLQEIVATWENRLTGTVRILPNPATTELRWQLPEQEGLSVRRLAVFTMDGKKVLEMNHLPTGSRLDVERLPAGTYLLGLETEKGWYAGKFEKM